MIIPKELEKAINEAKKSISDFGEPSLKTRINILEIIGDNSFTKHPNEGYYKRAKLALMCANKSIYVWDDFFPNEKEPYELLMNANDAFSNKISLEALEKKYFGFKTHLDDKFLLGEDYFRGIYAGFSVWSAVGTILYDSFLDIKDESEVKIPPEEWDSSFYAAMAISNGVSWDKLGNVKARKDFWIWYFDVAIIKVWNEV
jgi:hypothetical protein